MISGTATAGRLPSPLTSFVGRRRETAEVRRLLGAARLLTLTGVGGVGKTRLALEVGTASAKAFPDGVWLVDVAAVREPSAVAGAAAAALGVPDQGARPLLEQLAVHLSGRRALIVLDNCEHVVDACARVAERLLSAAPELRIMATSRETLGLTGEQVFAVAPLAPAEAVELLRERTARVRPDFEVGEANRDVVARLCADLDGVPLAIELAASRLRTLTVGQVAGRLEHRFALLTTGSRTARPHQRTLRATIDWSWELCTDAERQLWMRSAVFTGGFSLDAIEAVCAGDGIEAHGVLDLLDRLVSQSLVERTGAAEPPRYRMLETIRRYGWERLEQHGRTRALQRRHRDYFLALAERLIGDWFGPRQAEILAGLRAEHGNLMAALDYGDGLPEALPPADESGGDRQATLALVAALRYHWVAGGFLGEGRRRLERALAGAPEPTAARSRALVVAAYVALTQADPPAADRWLDEAERLSERLPQAETRAEVWGFRGMSALYQGRVREALASIEEAVAAHTALGDRPGAVAWTCALAIYQAVLGDARAPETGRRAVAATRELGERYACAHVLMTLGRRAWVLGDPAEAGSLTRESLETLRGFNDAIGVAKMVEQLAWIEASGGDAERAGRLLGAARSLWRDTGSGVDASDPRDAAYHARCAQAVLEALGEAGCEKALAAGGVVDGPERAIDFALGTETVDVASVTPASPLTRREREVAALIAKGLSNRKIAAELVLSPRTVDGHVENIRDKLGLTGRAQVAAWWAARERPV